MRSFARAAVRAGPHAAWMGCDRFGRLALLCQFRTAQAVPDRVRSRRDAGGLRRHGTSGYFPVSHHSGPRPAGVTTLSGATGRAFGYHPPRRRSAGLRIKVACMANARLRAVFMRGGTSKAVMFRRDDLPADPKDWDPIFLEVMGSPDPNGRQLDGMGGGISSLSKICVIGPSSRPDADVDYTFAQIGVRDTFVDYGANCGNMSSAVGPFALEEGLVPAPKGGEASIRIHNTNTSKIIVARFPTENGLLAAAGDIAIDGVAGQAAPIRLEFLDPGGARTGKLLPTGNARDELDIRGLGTV